MPIHHKSFQQIKIVENIFNMMKGIYSIPTMNMTLKGQRMTTFPYHKIRNETSMFACTTYIQHHI